jgi:hypothetical protein
VLKIELSGASAPSGTGLYIVAANSTVKGLVINRWDMGVNLGASNATGNRVVGNHVGTDASGTQDLGNVSDGVYVGEAPNTTIGGTTAGSRNVISGNGGDGIYITGNGATGNRVLQNSIYANGGLGIDLGDDGVTANDAGDADTGANGLQNKPVITSAKTGGGATTVNVRLNSTPNKTYLVQFFSNPSGTNEGRVFIGQRSVTTDGSSNASFIFSPKDKVGLGRTITATATSPGGNTSEFSSPRTVVAP